MNQRVGYRNVLMSGTALVEGDEPLVVTGGGTSLTIRWIRDDDNVLTGGTVEALTVDMPRDEPEVDVVHVFSVGSEGDERLVGVRFFVEWIHRWSKRVTYTVVGDS